MGDGGFKSLKVWQRSKDLAVYIYKITNNGIFNKDFGLRDQIRRAAVSIASNIAEGDGRDSDKESIRFFYIANGSLAELATQIQIAYEIEYIDKKLYEDIDANCTELGKMLGKLIKVRQQGMSQDSRLQARGAGYQGKD